MPHASLHVRPVNRFRPTITGLVWVGGALVLGSLVAPAIFNALLRAGRQFPFLTSLRDIEFESVWSRALLLTFLLLAYPCLTKVGKIRLRDVTFLKAPRWKTHLGQGIGAGLLSMGLLFLLGWWTGAYTWEPDPGLRGPGLWLGIILGALLVGLIEEVLFRGMLFGSLHRALGCRLGLVLASLVFSAVHFAKPLAREGVVYGYWHSGFSMLRHTFHAGHSTYHYFPYALTLFVMGLVLCLFYLRQGHLYFVMGLHAGWIMLMRLGGYMFGRAPETCPVLFGQSMVVAKTYMALMLALGFMIYAWFALRRGAGRRPERPC